MAAPMYIIEERTVGPVSADNIEKENFGNYRFNFSSNFYDILL